jgi:predicted TIM-barrel fold metal-dependent hydrolase
MTGEIPVPLILPEMPYKISERSTQRNMIIDSHVHLLPRRVQADRASFCRSDHAFASIYSSDKAKIVAEADILSYLDQSGIDKAVVFGFPWEDPDLVRENNDEVWAFHQRHTNRIIPFAVLSSGNRESALAEAIRAAEAGFRGFGELAMYGHGWQPADFEALGPTLRLAQTKRVPVLIHVNEPVGHHYPGKIPVDFQGLLHMIGEYPNVDFILAHFGGGVLFYALMPEIAQILGRTYVDTAASPFLYDAKVFEVACSILGPEKVLFGSDYPLLSLQRYLKEMDKVRIDPEARRAILGENLLRILSRD